MQPGPLRLLPPISNAFDSCIKPAFFKGPIYDKSQPGINWLTMTLLFVPQILFPEYPKPVFHLLSSSYLHLFASRILIRGLHPSVLSTVINPARSSSFSARPFAKRLTPRAVTTLLGRFTVLFRSIPARNQIAIATWNAFPDCCAALFSQFHVLVLSKTFPPACDEAAVCFLSHRGPCCLVMTIGWYQWDPLIN